MVVAYVYLSPRPATSPSPIKPPTAPVSVAGSATKGAATAPILLVIYSDFQCPFCARFATETWPLIEEKYVRTGQVRAAFKHLALPKHDLAATAAVAVECAGSQSRFWEMHDQVFKDQSRLAIDQLLATAASLGLNQVSFRQCMAGGSDKVSNDGKEANSMGIHGTPTFMIGRTMSPDLVRVSVVLSGARPIAEFDAAFAKVRASN